MGPQRKHSAARIPAAIGQIAQQAERQSFRVGKKIFATMTADGLEAMVRVRPVDRCLALLDSDPEVFFDHGGFTRRNGALGVRLAKVDAKLMRQLVGEAFEEVAQPRRHKTK